MKKSFCFFVFLFVCFLASAQEWYLISEPELKSIETYKEKSEHEKQSWLLQVQNLNQQVKKLKEQSTNLNQQVQDLNNQLQNQRQTNNLLEKSFNGLEKERFRQISLVQSELQLTKDKLNSYKSRFWIVLCIVISETIIFSFFIFRKFL